MSSPESKSWKPVTAWKDTTLNQVIQDPALDPWRAVFDSNKNELSQLSDRIVMETKICSTIYPPPHQVFRALTSSEPSEIKVVIVGQDPYHNGSAEGLCFSVPENRKLNPSLRNILKEVEAQGWAVDMNKGSLASWADQHVLLLNTALTVTEGNAGSHTDFWNTFTRHLICFISEKTRHVVWMLWGKHAQAYKKFIDGSKHCILEAGHPSPLARGAFARDMRVSPHFQMANEYLESKGKTKVYWNTTQVAV